ncbi:MAG: chemotaxis protein CheW [Planctomycetes bacterium]|nr:chemotaxis protein CheW [Planctomycetota bacterium]
MLIRCLQVRVADREFGLPIDAIANIAEYEVTPPPPLARAFVGGLAVDGDTLFAVVSLDECASRADTRRRAKCVRIKSRGKSAPWGLVVESVGRIVELEPTPTRIEVPRVPSAWLTAARDAGGVDVPVIAIESLRRELDADGAKTVAAA